MKIYHLSYKIYKTLTFKRLLIARNDSFLIHFNTFVHYKTLTFKRSYFQDLHKRNYTFFIHFDTFVQDLPPIRLMGASTGLVQWTDTAILKSFQVHEPNGEAGEKGESSVIRVWGETNWLGRRFKKCITLFQRVHICSFEVTTIHECFSWFKRLKNLHPRHTKRNGNLFPYIWYLYSPFHHESKGMTQFSYTFIMLSYKPFNNMIHLFTMWLDLHP